MTRRALLAALLAGVVVGNARAITPDRPDVVLIADEETGYDQTVALAGATGLRVKPVFPAPLADAEVNDTGQVVAEKLLARMAPVTERLQACQDAPGALVIVLVARDMNGADGSTHLVFAESYAAVPLGVLSLARLRFGVRGGDGVFETRACKMMLRMVGQHLWHLPRSLDPHSVMMSPLTGLGDLDAMGIDLKRPE